MEVFKKGDLVEGYRILSELGRGAASIIYIAQDEKTKQIWALKDVQRIDEKSERFLEQAEVEYKIAQKLQHETIRKIPKMVKKKKLLTVNRLYLVMEFVDGKAMDTYLPKTFEQACHVFRQAAQAMNHMHQKGFVHADFKPNNLVVDGELHAKIIDLGQSCPIGTIKKRIQGTPDYIAPEQVHRREITPKTDVYNLGASMYWVLTRTKVPTALGKEGSLMGRVDDTLMERPKPANEINERIPVKLSELIMQCLEISPDNRPGMDEVIDRLELIHAMLKAGVKSASGQLKAVKE